MIEIKVHKGHLEIYRRTKFNRKVAVSGLTFAEGRQLAEIMARIDKQNVVVAEEAIEDTGTLGW